MNEILVMEEVSKIASFNGINVYNIKTDKFKTNTVHIFFCDDLSYENVTKNALVPAVLRRGSQNHPSFRDLSQYLEQLYGASFDCGVSKKGERQIIQFYIEYVSEKYTGKDDRLSEKALDLLEEIITQPLFENGLFKKSYVDQEKENLRRRIESRINDKVRYAVDRCLEELCKGEPYELHEYGLIDQLENITEEDLQKQYKYIIETLPVFVFISGDNDKEALEKIVNRLKQIPRGNIKELSDTVVSDKPVQKIREVTEKMNITQGKLSMGFKTNTATFEDDYYALAVYNGILGGGIHSKLFQNVREKASLAYYSFSRLDKFKGLMVISSGVEIENKQKAIDIIKEQLQEIKKGNITDYEFNSTLKAYETGVKSMADSHIRIVDFYFSQALFGTDDTLETLIKKINRVTRDEVINVAKKIEPGVVYFLTSMD